MRRQGCLFHQEIIVADFERIVELFFAGLLGRFIGGRERDHLTVRPPRELLDANSRFSDLNRIAASHGHHEYLRLGVDARGQKRQPIARWRPAR